MRQAVHFGGGNIGRGFIGEILSDNGFSITFIDVNEKLINQLNRDGKYTIEIYGLDKVAKTVNNVSGINSVIDPDGVSEAILNSEIVTCSVGPNNLKYIAGNIANGIKKRFEKEVVDKLDIIACENMVCGTRVLKSEVYQYLDDKERVYAASYIGFPNASVDRIVPNIKYENIISVGVESYKEWIVETKHSKTYPKLQLNDVKYVEDILPYTERKLLSVNTGHAAIAYGGLLLGYEDVVSALKDPVIQKHVREVLHQTGAYLRYTYDLDKDEHQDYINKLLQRFKNKDINDQLIRIARNPIQKLGLNERFMIPLLGLYDAGLPHDALVHATASVFLFDSDDDKQSVTLQSRLNSEPLEDVIRDITGIDEESLIEQIGKEILKLRKNVKYKY